MRRVLIWAPLGFFALVFALVMTGLLAPSDRAVKSAMVGKPVPGFVLPALVPGKPGVNSAAFADGKPRLINVFASWCVPCIAEAPQLMKLKQQGVEIVGVATADTPEDMANFLKTAGDPFAAIGDDRIRKVQFALGSAGVPESFVIDGSGKIVMQHIGYIGPQDMPKILAALAGVQP
ncbi:redoxin family protein [Sphingomonas sp. LB-2]|uniref:redoxin family protein n=1 Tax=Sphingomonas caeni TaxID=2984949 RepID=UPI002231C07A|nr:redoxin family protein [Sphingomonas caeni]MCW3848416.1 redoxin family protein [Sphingomonas caeni]